MTAPATGQPSRGRSAWDWFVLDRRTGRSTVAMAPNLPIGIFWAATGVRMVTRPKGTWNTALQVAATSALTWWAADELLRGTSPLRRTLGAVALAGVVGNVARASNPHGDDPRAGARPA